jgi:phytoene desaturase
LKFDINKTLNDTNQKYLKEPHLVQLYNRYATYNGSNPYETSGIMSLIQHLESHFGTWIPNNGMVQISKSITRLLEEKGVKIYLNSNVEEILIGNRKAQGVILNGKKIMSDYVVSNMDVFFTYEKLLKSYKMPKRVNKSERSSSALIFYWGIKKSFDQLDLHNILFSDDYRDEFESIFQKGKISNDPTVYINITSKDIPGDAPKGCENWFVMVNAPYDSEQSWNDITARLKKIIIKKINRSLHTNIEEYIQVEKVYTPQTIETKTQSFKGALYGTSSNSKLSAFLRHPNFSTNLKNLFFCGGSVHPGGGIPLCMLSAKIVSDQLKDLSNA